MTSQSIEGQVSMLDLDSQSGRMFSQHSLPTKVRTSGPSSKPSAASAMKPLMYLDLRERERGGLLPDASWEKVTALPGVPWKLHYMEFPSDVRESTLSQILDLNAPEKYSLSAIAASGISRRAEKRGKVLPPMLKEALLEAMHGKC